MKEKDEALHTAPFRAFRAGYRRAGSRTLSGVAGMGNACAGAKEDDGLEIKAVTGEEAAAQKAKEGTGE